MTPLETLLESYRTAAISERDKGTAFEKLIASWLPVDTVQAQRIKTAELWSDWARRRGRDRSDTGIDLVATRHDGGLAAVQCKFFARDRRIQKNDIDSFISASGKHEFVERIIVESTAVAWSDKAEAMIDRQTIPVTRIGLYDLMARRICSFFLKSRELFASVFCASPMGHLPREVTPRRMWTVLQGG